MHLSVNVRGDAGGDEFRGDEPASQNPREAASSSSWSRRPFGADADADADAALMAGRVDADAVDEPADVRAGEPCADAVAGAAAGAPAVWSKCRPTIGKRTD